MSFGHNGLVAQEEEDVNEERENLLEPEEFEESVQKKHNSGSFRVQYIACFILLLLITLFLFFALDGHEFIFPLVPYKQNEIFLKQFDKHILENYVLWHNKTLEMLVNSSVSTTNVKYLVWKGNHGIGDRFRAIMNVFLAAIISERFLLLDWGNSLPVSEILSYGYNTNFSYDSRILGDLGELDGPRSTKSAIEDLELLLTDKRIVISVANSRPKKEYFLKIHKTYPNLKFSKVFASIWHDGIDPSDIDFNYLLLSKLIHPTDLFLKFVTQLKNRGLIKHPTDKMMALPERYISIHVRYGKGVNEGGLKRFNFTKFGLNESSISNCLSRKAVKMARGLGMSSGRYFLATDTVEIRKMLGDALMNRDKHGEVYYGNWDIKHVQSLSSENQDDVQKLILTFAELEILSKGLGMVHLYSGFADIAKWIGRIKISEQVSYQFCADFAGTGH